MSLFLTISCFISLQPLLPHVSFCLVSVLGWNIAVQHCVMESQTSIIPYPVHRLQKKQLQGIGLPVKPEGCEGRATCSPAPQEACGPTHSFWSRYLQSKTQVPQEEDTSSIAVLLLQCSEAMLFRHGFLSRSLILYEKFRPCFFKE